MYNIGKDRTVHEIEITVPKPEEIRTYRSVKDAYVRLFDDNKADYLKDLES